MIAPTPATRELDYQPGRFLIRHYVRLKFVRKEASVTVNHSSEASALSEPKEVLLAPLPNRLVEKGLPGIGLLIHLLLSRFEDHLPFFRLEKIFWERHAVPISRQSMIDWMEQLAFWFAPIYEEMKTQLLAGDYLQIDETVIRYLDREVPGRSCQGYFWVYSRPGGDVIFDWQTSRGHQAPLEFLRRFHGRMQTDGFAVYRTLAEARARQREDKQSGLLHFCCWAHARRKFFEAKDHDRRAAWFLRQIGLLYEIEKRLRLRKAGPRLREAVRGGESKMILSRIGQALRRVQPRVLAQSNLGRAISYTLSLWPELNRYADHGEVEIDNNLVENAIRPTAIGKKNFLFIGHPEAGGRSAMIYSILGSCRRHGIDPAQYLADVLARLPDMKASEIPSVTPGAWAKAHPQARILPRK
jgi:transposase